MTEGVQSRKQARVTSQFSSERRAALGWFSIAGISLLAQGCTIGRVMTDVPTATEPPRNKPTHVPTVPPPEPSPSPTTPPTPEIRRHPLVEHELVDGVRVYKRESPIGSKDSGFYRRILDGEDDFLLGIPPKPIEEMTRQEIIDWRSSILDPNKRNIQIVIAKSTWEGLGGNESKEKPIVWYKEVLNIYDDVLEKGTGLKIPIELTSVIVIEDSLLTEYGGKPHQSPAFYHRGPDEKHPWHYNDFGGKISLANDLTWFFDVNYLSVNKHESLYIFESGKQVFVDSGHIHELLHGLWALPDLYYYGGKIDLANGNEIEIRGFSDDIMSSINTMNISPITAFLIRQIHSIGFRSVLANNIPQRKDVPDQAIFSFSEDKPVPITDAFSTKIAKSQYNSETVTTLIRYPDNSTDLQDGLCILNADQIGDSFPFIGFGLNERSEIFAGQVRFVVPGIVPRFTTYLLQDKPWLEIVLSKNYSEMGKNINFFAMWDTEFEDLKRLPAFLQNWFAYCKPPNSPIVFVWR